mmetsp:Transcript_51391/g.51786  ORF Transcript_51391/g.51786 Transcript_51391/m.51786 type:complete len:92 (+) Transcript_51391:529-804(+)
MASHQLHIDQKITARAAYMLLASSFGFGVTILTNQNKIQLLNEPKKFNVRVAYILLASVLVFRITNSNNKNEFNLQNKTTNHKQMNKRSTR